MGLQRWVLRGLCKTSLSSGVLWAVYVLLRERLMDTESR